MCAGGTKIEKLTPARFTTSRFARSGNTTVREQWRRHSRRRWRPFFGCLCSEGRKMRCARNPNTASRYIYICKRTSTNVLSFQNPTRQYFLFYFFYTVNPSLSTSSYSFCLAQFRFFVSFFFFTLFFDYTRALLLYRIFGTFIWGEGDGAT